MKRQISKKKAYKTNKKKRHIFLKIVLIVIAVIALLTGWGVFSSYNVLTVTEYEVRSDKVAGDVNILLISDLHDHSFGRANSALVERIRMLQPDLILMDGDFLNSDSPDTHIPLELVPQLAGIAPVCYSLGNQEEGYINNHRSDGGDYGVEAESDGVSAVGFGDGAERGGAADDNSVGNSSADNVIAQDGSTLIADLEAAGAIVLDKNYITTSVNGTDLVIGGIYDYAFGFDGGGHMDKSKMPEETLAFLESFQAEQPFKIMMAHRPDSFLFGDAEDTWDIDLVLSGHLHGGQVIIPFVGGLYGGDFGFFPEYDFGEYHFSAVRTMLITRGLGSDREKLPRFNNMPEIVMIRLRGE